jgi:hypothetical protein
MVKPFCELLEIHHWTLGGREIESSRIRGRRGGSQTTNFSPSLFKTFKNWNSFKLPVGIYETVAAKNTLPELL